MAPSSTHAGDTLAQHIAKTLSAWTDLHAALGDTAAALARYANEFFIPSLIAAAYFQQVEQDRIRRADARETADAYQDLFRFNLSLWLNAMNGAGDAFFRYMALESGRTFDAFGWAGTLLGKQVT